MLASNLIIRPATPADFAALYALGSATKELQTSSDNPFMDEDEFAAAIVNPRGLFLAAFLNEELVGFTYASLDDIDNIHVAKGWACLVYIAVRPDARRHGLANELLASALAALKNRGVTHVYAWANAEHDPSPVIEFMKKQGFNEGHHYVWMDKEL